MVVTVFIMFVMKTTVNNIVYVISVNDRLMLTIRAMNMLMEMFFVAFNGIMISNF